MTGTLVIVGAPGAGKTTVLGALSSRLEAAGVQHGTFESEQLSQGFPTFEVPSWAPQLGAVLALQRAAGRSVFAVTATVESEPELVAVRAAVADDPVLVACVDAPAEVLAGRLDRREPDDWPGKRSLIERARAMAGRVPAFAGVDIVLDTTGSTPQQAAAVLAGAMEGCGIVPESS